MEYVILVIAIAFIAVFMVGRHQKDVEEDPVEHWEPPEELHIHHITPEEKAKKK